MVALYGGLKCGLNGGLDGGLDGGHDGGLDGGLDGSLYGGLDDGMSNLLFKFHEDQISRSLRTIQKLVKLPVQLLALPVPVLAPVPGWY